MSKTIVAIGEALWDVFPDGRRPGGAPCNVAFHAARLGDRGVIVTRVGDDAWGSELVAFLRDRGVDTGFVQRDTMRPTGSVAVTIEGSEPRYAIATDVAWDHLTADEDARALVRTADAVCIGSLAQRGARSRDTVQQFLADARGRALVVFDVNLRPPFVDADVIEATLRAADVVRMSEPEVDELAKLLGRSSLIASLLEDTGVSAVCVTRGKHGASITTRQGTVVAAAVDVDISGGDTVGAGDAFTAALAHQLIRRAAPQEAVVAASRYAGLIASKRGAMPAVSREELTRIGW